MPEIPHLSRRGLLAAGGAAGLGALLAACGSGGDGGAATTRGGGWSFTDDRGQKVTTRPRPRRVVAYVGTAAALRDFGVEASIVGVFGPTTRKDGRPDPLAGDLDVNKVTVLGNAWGEFNIEKYASLRPELLVTDMFQPPALWYVPDDAKKKILTLAPSVGFAVSKVTLPEPIRRHEQLAAALGADLRAKPVTDAKARFDRATASLRAAVEANPGIRVMAASGSPDLLYVSDPPVYADLGYYRSLGVDFVIPDKVTGGFFENLSWENAGKYRADLILLDRTRTRRPRSSPPSRTGTRAGAPWTRTSVPSCAATPSRSAAARADGTSSMSSSRCTATAPGVPPLGGRTAPGPATA